MRQAVNAMPAISMFYGIVVFMYCEEGAKHSLAHLHAKYGEHKASYTLKGELIKGSFPRNKERLLLAWMEIHYDELKADWDLAVECQALFKIEPLR